MNTEKKRCYFVIDMKSFFASVECSLRGLDPMTTDLVVADKERSETTICLAVSPSLKAKGVKNRCRLYEIPKGMKYEIAPPQMDMYIKFASEIYGIYLQYIDKSDIHCYSIDECFLDVTDYLRIYNTNAKDFAQMLMQEIWEKLKIPATTGIGTNLFLAKIALDITAKHSPDRIGWLTEEKFRKELWHHKPLTDFWQISVGTLNRLAKYGISDMFGIAHCSEDILYNEFGVNAELLIDHSWGIETCLMSDIKNYKTKGSKSISNSQILPTAYKFNDALIVLKEMIQDGCYRLARENLVTNLVNLQIGYQDDRFNPSKGSKRLNNTSNLFSIIEPFCDRLFNEITDKNRLIRQISYSFGKIQPETMEQYDLFTDYEAIKKEKNLVKSILSIQDRYGKNALLKGLDLSEKATQRERNNMIGGHRIGKKN